MGTVRVIFSRRHHIGSLALRNQRHELELGHDLALAELARQRDERLERVSQAATMLTLASGMAHELSTPLGVIRSRTVYYTLALSVVGGLTLWSLISRPEADLHVIRDRNPVFVRMHDGAVRDGYTLKIGNRTFEERRFDITFEGVPGARLSQPGASGDKVSIVVPADQVAPVRVFVTAPPPGDVEMAASVPGRFVIRSGDVRAEAKTVFLSGAANPQ